MDKKVGTIMLTITNECNLNCVYCYEKHKKNKVISLKIAKSYIKKYLSNPDYKIVNINIFGGEAFLYFERIKEICEWTWAQKWEAEVKFYLSTNGTILTPEIKKWLEENKDKLYISLSLDGTRESHNKNRSNSYDRIDLEFFLHKCQNPSVKMTISELDLYNLSENVIHIHKLGFVFSECNLAVGLDWSSNQNLTILKRELKKLCDFYIDNPDIKPAQIIDMEVDFCENNKVLKKWCGIGTNLIMVDTDGKTYPCNFITPMTFTQKEIDLVINTNFSNVKSLTDDGCFNNCYIYPICPTCYGENYLMTKSINLRYKGICNLMRVRAFYASMLKAHKIVNINIDKLSKEEKAKTYKTITAIKKINELYSNI